MTGNGQNRSFVFVSRCVQLVVIIILKEKSFDESRSTLDVIVEFPFLLVDEGFAIDARRPVKIAFQRHFAIEQSRANGNTQLLNVRGKVMQIELRMKGPVNVAEFFDLQPVAAFLQTVFQLFATILSDIQEEELRMPMTLRVFSRQLHCFSCLDTALLLVAQARDDLLVPDKPASFDGHMRLELLGFGVQFADAKKDQTHRDMNAALLFAVFVKEMKSSNA